MNMPSPKTFLRLATLAVLPAIAAGCLPVDPLANGDGPVDDFTTLYQTGTFQGCVDCHAPGAPGFVDGTEITQDWSTRDTAFTSLKGNAAGLIGNQQDCNGVPLIGPTSDQSLLVAVFDPTVRDNFSYPGFPNCTGVDIVDETLRAGYVPLSAADLARLKAFIDAGGFQ